MNRIESYLQGNTDILIEGSIIERVRRETEYPLDEQLLNAEMLYNERGRNILTKMYKEYVQIGKNSHLPMILLTPTWRANSERLVVSSLPDVDTVNRYAVRFMQEIRAKSGTYAEQIILGGLTGCRGDAYDPSEAMETEAAFEFHSPQAMALADEGVDFLLASTLPELSEAKGIGKAFGSTGIPYILSFVVRPSGHLLDGTLLQNAIQQVDTEIDPRPLAYMINCVHPSVFDAAMENGFPTDARIRDRIIGLQANSSDLSPEELDSAEELKGDIPVDYGIKMVHVHWKHSLRIIGGCCGTNQYHIHEIAVRLNEKDQ